MSFAQSWHWRAAVALVVAAAVVALVVAEAVVHAVRSFAGARPARSPAPMRPRSTTRTCGCCSATFPSAARSCRAASPRGVGAQAARIGPGDQAFALPSACCLT